MKLLKNEYDKLLLSGRTLSESEFLKKTEEFLEWKTEEEKEYIRNCMFDVFKEKVSEIKSIKSEISVLKQLSGVEEYINMAKISKEYFGKTKSWIYQRLHGYPVHGKPAKFTNAEKKKLSDALMQLSEDIKAVAMKIA